MKVLSALDDQMKSEMARIERDMEKKGKSVVWEEEVSIFADEANLNNEGNPFRAALGMAKIAFGGLLHELPGYQNVYLRHANK